MLESERVLGVTYNSMIFLFSQRWKLKVRGVQRSAGITLACELLVKPQYLLGKFGF